MKNPGHTGLEIEPDRPVLDYLELCPVCGQLFDLRDLDQVMDRLHAPDVDNEPARPN